MNNKKKIIIISSSIILVILIVVVLIFIFKDKKTAIIDDNKKYEPQFLNEVEKESFGLPAEVKVQAFRDESGEVATYKIIKNDSDIVSDPVAEKLITPQE